jgi:hypothetical protein
MARLRKDTIEDRWFDVFKTWSRLDREAAIKALRQINRVLPDAPTREEAEGADLDLSADAQI